MIFLTTGTQLPFDRLVRFVDDWAGSHPSVEIFAQIGPGKYKPRNFNSVDYLDQSSYRECFERAQGLVSHAGMGTILTTLMAGKPVVIMPRRADLGEHRNDHQVATCRKLVNLKGCYIAWEGNELCKILTYFSDLKSEEIDPYASHNLLAAIRQYIEG